MNTTFNHPSKCGPFCAVYHDILCTATQKIAVVLIYIYRHNRDIKTSFNYASKNALCLYSVGYLAVYRRAEVAEYSAMFLDYCKDLFVDGI